MTRFARAKGSKSSNERVPEDATSWREMKQQLTEKKQEVEENKKRKKAEENRKKNYQNFLDDLENEKKEEWAEFDDEEAKTGRVQKKRKVESERFEELVGQIEEVLKKEKEDRVEAKAKKQKVNKEDSKETKIKCNGNKKPKEVGIEPKKPNEELIEEKKVKKKKDKQLKITNKTTESSNKNATKVLKNGSAKPKQTQIKVKKPYEELTEEEKARVDKKKQQKQKQKEKKKQFKTTNKTVEQPNQNNRKPPKPRDNKEHQRRKPNPNSTTMNINGIEVKISYFDGFPIKSEDADRLQKLRKEMVSKGIPRSEVRTALKLERRKAEKALAREKKKVCFNCRKSGHVLSECPNLTGSNAGVETVGSGVCFKCGSTEHTHFECRVVRGDDYKFASCFICKEQGHISRQCPDNNRGLYPKGGACKVCGDVTHLKKDCPKYQAQQLALNVEVDSMSFDNVEGIDNTDNYNFKNKKVNKVIKF